MPRKIHASSAELGDCPFREEQYTTGRWMVEPRTYFIRGQCAHLAREFALGAYLRHGELPSLAQVTEKAVADIEVLNDEGEDDRSPWRRPATDEELTEGIDEALPLIEADYHLALPEIAPHVEAVETADDVPIEGTQYVLTGRLDIRGRDPMTKAATILDLKTAKKNPGGTAQAKADMSQQLSIYALMHKILHGTIPVFCLDYLWPGKRKPRSTDGLQVHEFKGAQPGGVKLAMRRVVTTQRSPADLDAAVRRLRVKIDAMEGGWHPPAPVGALTSPCTDCVHRGNRDAEQRCPYVPDRREA